MRLRGILMSKFWRTPDKDSSSQPSIGSYNDWKDQVANECHRRCVYCAILEQDWGGIRNFHIDHFKPKSIFPDLKEDILNLFYACSVCNVFKGSDWKGDSLDDLSNESYANPMEFDYNELFNVSSDGILASEFVTSKYMIERLFLNRPQLILWRRRRVLREKFNSLRKDFNENVFPHLKDNRDGDNQFKAVYMKMQRLLDLMQEIEDQVSYETQDLKKS